MESRIDRRCDGLTDEVEECLQIGQEQVARIVRLTKNLNQFARVSRNEKISCGLNSLIDRVLALEAPRLRFESVQLMRRHPMGNPSLWLDKDRIFQVFLNIINNSITAMQGAERKELHICTSLKGNNTVVIRIADTGTGIPPEMMGKIYDPFFPTKEPGQGTGLGLSISYGIVEDHGGTITAESNEWGGASFLIELPLDRPSGKKQEESGGKNHW